MKILLLTKNKKYTNLLLRNLLESGHEIVGVVFKSLDSFSCETQLYKMCQDYQIPVFDNTSIYDAIRDGSVKIDLAVSFIYGRLIRKELIQYTNGKCINLHPAPLPEYRGLFVYNHALLNRENTWGVTCHYVNESFDKGDIIEVSKFLITPDEISVNELEVLSSQSGYELLIKIIGRFERGEKIESYPQGDGTYYNRSMFEELKKINIDDTKDTVNRKIHAFWAPPYEGAYIEIDGERFTLINNKTLENLTPPQ